MINKVKKFLFDLFRGEYERQVIKKAKQEQVMPEEIKLKCAFYSNLKTWIVLNAVCFIFLVVQLLFGIPGLSDIVAMLIFLAFFLMLVPVGVFSPLFECNKQVTTGFALQRLFGRKLIVEKIHLCGMYFRPTRYVGVPADNLDIIDMFPEDYCAQGVSVKYQLLTDMATPKKSPHVKPFCYYEPRFFCGDLRRKKCKSVNWIMTKQKSDLLDELIRLEPVAEFEIRYLKYSKLLQEIRPIEGWKYAEGVPELCEKISKMYP